MKKIRALFESEAWTILVSRTEPHQRLLQEAMLAKSEAIISYLMSRLNSRAREQGFQVMEDATLADGIKRRLGFQQ